MRRGLGLGDLAADNLTLWMDGPAVGPRRLLYPAKCRGRRVVTCPLSTRPTTQQVAHHGSTDPLIVIKVLEHSGISKDQVRTRC